LDINVSFLTCSLVSQITVLFMLRWWLVAGEIASMLSISIKTVETYRSNVMRKLEIHNVSEWVRYAMRNRIIEP